MLRRVRAGRLALSLLLAVGLATASASSAAASKLSRHLHINCAESTVCTEVGSYQEVFGKNYYVGHDEPTTLFYSNKPGSGNRMRYTLTLPKDPSPDHPNTPGKSYEFELGSTIWFGMSMCDTQSYPEQVDHCTPDSDSNITTGRNLAKHPGVAFTELQFYSPGWVGWPTWAVAAGASTCDPTKWCAALNIDSLEEDPVNGTLQNPTCAARTGIEPVNFAFVTRNGKSTGPANPLQSTLATFTPDASRDLFMNSGDRISVAMFDTPDGLKVELKDLNTGQIGSMTASPANGFAQIKFNPTGDKCQAIPYAFHPMYSTSSEATQTIWGADQYNIAFDQEIGHFQHCYGPPVPLTPFGLDNDGNPITCGEGHHENDGEPADPPTATGGDDDFCFPEAKSELVRVQGCSDTNTGFDGDSYHPVWPDGNTALHPTPVQFTSPLTGTNFDQQYERAALSVDLPRIEFNTCNRETGQGCTLIPTTDDGTPAAFYPYFSIANSPSGQCVWQFGDSIPGTTNDFGKNAGYGNLIKPTYLTFGGHGSIRHLFNDFRHIFRTNPCPA
jgi:hypothetical protein